MVLWQSPDTPIMHQFNWLRAFMLSCLVWTRGLWVFSLAVCSCPVLHMAGDLFCWPCVFVLWEHMAFILVFSVPCALMSIVLTPPILSPDYCLICPTCLLSLPSSFAPFICTYAPFVCSPVPVRRRCYPVSCPVLPCQALLPVCFPLRGGFCLMLFVLFFTDKAHSPAQILASSLHPNPDSNIV